MKKPHEHSTTLITSPQQRRAIEELKQNHLEEGGAIFAQVFHDGLRIKVLTPKQALEFYDAFCKALGKTLPHSLKNSAFQQTGSAK